LILNKIYAKKNLLQAFNSRPRHYLALLKKHLLEFFSFSKHNQICICTPLFFAMRRQSHRAAGLQAHGIFKFKTAAKMNLNSLPML